MAGRDNDQDDEAMEWITDWEYERVIVQPPQAAATATATATAAINSTTVLQINNNSASSTNIKAIHHQEYGDADGGYDDDDDDDTSMELEEEEDAPIPLAQADEHRQDSSKEMSIFWTRASEEFTDDELHGMFGQTLAMEELADHTIIADRPHSHNTATNNSRRGSSVFMEDAAVPESKKSSKTRQTAGAATNNNSSSSLAAASVVAAPAREEEEDDAMILGPLQDKEGLLPPMSDSQLYHGGNAQYEMIESHNDHVPKDSTGTHTTVGMMEDDDDEIDDEQSLEDYEPRPDVVETDPNHSSVSSNNSDAIFERQQQLLQQVLQEAPGHVATRRASYELPRPSDSQQRMLQEMKEARPTKATSSSTKNKSKSKHKTASSSSSQQGTNDEDEEKDDPIFARQQEIFHQMRAAEQAKQKEQQQQADKQYSHPHHHHHHHHHPHHQHPYSSYPRHPGSPSPGPSVGSNNHHHHHPSHEHYSPNSVTKTLTQAGMDSDEYHKVVTRLTEKNLLERQRLMLQESMKRSLETRQALHIKPTALPDYNHDKLSQVLSDIESSSRNISETYGRRTHE